MINVLGCLRTHFQCRAGKCKYEWDDDNCYESCIHSSWKDDGTKDCTDGSDEAGK